MGIFVFRKHEVGCQLSFEEFVVGHVLIQSLDHPLPKCPGIGVGEGSVVAHDVSLIFCIPGNIQPKSGPAFTKVGRFQKLFYVLFIILFGGLFVVRRQSGQSKSDATFEGSLIRFGIGFQIGFFHLFENKSIYRSGNPVWILQSRNFMPLRLLKRPELRRFLIVVGSFLFFGFT